MLGTLQAGSAIVEHGCEPTDERKSGPQTKKGKPFQTVSSRDAAAERGREFADG